MSLEFLFLLILLSFSFVLVEFFSNLFVCFEIAWLSVARVSWKELNNSSRLNEIGWCLFIYQFRDGSVLSCPDKIKGLRISVIDMKRMKWFSQKLFGRIPTIHYRRGIWTEAWNNRSLIIKIQDSLKSFIIFQIFQRLFTIPRSRFIMLYEGPNTAKNLQVFLLSCCISISRKGHNFH